MKQTKQINDALRRANLNFTLAHTYSMLPFMCRKNSTSDKYQRLGNEQTNEALFLLFSRGNN